MSDLIERLNMVIERMSDEGLWDSSDIVREAIDALSQGIEDASEHPYYRISPKQLSDPAWVGVNMRRGLLAVPDIDSYMSILGDKAQSEYAEMKASIPYAIHLAGLLRETQAVFECDLVTRIRAALANNSANRADEQITCECGVTSPGGGSHMSTCPRRAVNAVGLRSDGPEA